MLLKSLIYDCIWEPCSSFESMRGEYDVECEEYSYTDKMSELGKTLKNLWKNEFV